jgi:hypothetical protein
MTLHVYTACLNAPVHSLFSPNQTTPHAAHARMLMICFGAPCMMLSLVPHSSPMKLKGKSKKAANAQLSAYKAVESWLVCRPAVACSVTGVGEAIMRAGLARECARSLAEHCPAAWAAAGKSCADLATDVRGVDDISANVICGRIECGQPAALPCPHMDCGVLAVRASLGRRSAQRLLKPDGAPGQLELQAGSEASLEACGVVPAFGMGGCPAGMTTQPEATCPDNNYLNTRQAQRSDSATAAAQQATEHREHPNCNNGDVTAEQGSLGQVPSDDLDAAASELLIELGVAHNSGSMGIGFFAQGMESPQCVMLRSMQKTGQTQRSGMCQFGAVFRCSVPRS